MNMLMIIFLRLYGLNLERGFRNKPDQACNDAIMQMSMVLAVPIAIVLGILAIVIPGALSHIKSPDPILLAIVLVTVVPLVHCVNKCFGRYRSSPGLAEPFRTRRERIKSAVAFIVIPTLSVAFLGYLAYLAYS